MSAATGRKYAGDQGYVELVDRYTIRACDTKVDGRGVWARYYVKAKPNTLHQTYLAPSKGCTTRQHSVPIEVYRS